MSITINGASAPRKSALVAMAAAIAAMAAGQALADGHHDPGISQSGEQKDMRRVGHVDLQGRPSYQPNFVVYPDGRTIAFAGTHGGSKPNPLKPGSPVESNGTMIIDASNPSRPVELFHLPVPLAGGQAQMVRLCNNLAGGVPRHVYLLRNIQGSPASGYELWDVTDPGNPAPVAALTGLRNTHKDWIECSTGIAYMPGSKDVQGANRWRQGQSMVIYDWSNPPLAKAPGTAIPNYGDTYPKYIRTFGLPGGQPGSTGPTSTSLHGAISAFEHPKAALPLARGSDIIGNRVYAAWGVGDDGVMQILDRSKLLGVVPGQEPTASHPTEDELLAPQVGVLYTSPDQGGHTSMPVFGLTPASYTNFTEFKTRDIVVLTSEATADLCQEAPHWSFIVDVTVENSKTQPPATRLETNPAQGPMVLSTLSVDPRSGEKYPRGNYCTRGARFGVHSSEENFRNPYYGRLVFIAYFTGGIRVWDIREPQAPVAVAFYVPVSNANTTQPDGYMTNNVEVDGRGFIYATDRNGSGLDILELTGKAKCIGLGTDCHGDRDDD
jgi:hypothetical protein